MTQSVLVLGAGELGMSVIEALTSHPSKQGTRFSVLLRQSTIDSANPDRKKTVQRLKALKVDVDVADVVLASKEELAELFGKYDVVVSCNGMGFPSGTQTKIAKAALEGKVKRFFPWQFGVDYDTIGEGSAQDLFDEQLAIRKILRSQDYTDWLIISNGLFMSFLFLGPFGTVDPPQKTVRALGSWSNRVTLTTAQDIGRITAELVLDARDLHKQVVFVAGDTVSYEQVAELVEERFGKGFKKELWDEEVLRKQREDEPENPILKYRGVFAKGVGVAWDREGTENRRRGMEMTDLRTYLKEMDDSTVEPET